LFTSACFNTLKSYSVTPYWMNFHWALCHTTARNIISEIINIIYNLTHLYTFSNCIISRVFKSIISKWTNRNASPCCIVFV
jgi:hypothetical protein